MFWDTSLYFHPSPSTHTTHPHNTPPPTTSQPPKKTKQQVLCVNEALYPPPPDPFLGLPPLDQQPLSSLSLEATRSTSGGSDPGSTSSGGGGGIWARRRAGLLPGIHTAMGLPSLQIPMQGGGGLGVGGKGDGGAAGALAAALGRGQGRPVLPLVINAVNHGTVLHHCNGEEEQAVLPAEPLRRVFVQVRVRAWGF